MTYPYSVISSANLLDDIKLCNFNLAFASDSNTCERELQIFNAARAKRGRTL